MRESTSMDIEHLALMRDLNINSHVSVPLVVRDKTIGLLSLGQTKSQRRFTQSNLPFVEEIARRTAQAIDNARLYEQAQAAIHARDEFLSIAAHDLRTPITSLRGFAQVLIRRLDRAGAVEPQQLRKALTNIDKQSQKLTTLVAQLLDITRLEANRLVLDRQLTDVSALVRELVQRVQITTTHPISLSIKADLVAQLDALRMEQVLTNLLDNAIKYTPDGSSIIIQVSSQHDAVCIIVADQGGGIPPEHRPYIFERFYRAPESAATQGMGLGLYISRQIVELHGGKIWAEFPDDGSTRFVIKIPCTIQRLLLSA